jgi:hypothetical protein
LEKFVQDVAIITEKLCRDEGNHVSNELNRLRKKLVILYRKGVVKINHSVMELVCAKHLIKKGYFVDTEKQVSDILVCDLFAKKGDSSEVVEIETGFVPPDHALDPVQSGTARIASKIARYSQFAEKFSLGTPPHNLLPIPELFLVPPRFRKRDDVEKLKRLLDKYYTSPEVRIEQITNARLQMIYIVNADTGHTAEVDPLEYHRIAKMAGFAKQDTNP